jgi:hypothetical protein
VVILSITASAHGQHPFNYQGQLKRDGLPLDGMVDLEFSLWDAEGTGSMVGAPVTIEDVEVDQGLFSVALDFGVVAFNGDPRWLEIAVASPAGTGSYEQLSPRQRVTGAPYALHTRGLYVDDEQRVGIGTASPGSVVSNSKLDVVGGHIALSNNYGIFSYNSTGDGLGAGMDTHPDDSLDLYAGGDARVSVTADGKVGIGTNSPSVALDVRGRLALDDGAEAIVYTAASGGEQGRHLELLNSPDHASASGLKAGGILVADDYTYASPPKNDLIVKGRTGIGTASPGGVISNSKLDVVGGHIALDNDYGVLSYNRFGSGIGAGFDTTTSDHLQLYAGGASQVAVTDDGHVGIGTNAPSASLHVSSDANPNLQITQTNNSDFARLIMDANGSKFHLSVGAPGTSIPDTFNIYRSGTGDILSVAAAGRVGINTTDPQTSLHVNGSARIDGSVTIPATTRYMHVSAAAFHPYRNTVVDQYDLRPTVRHNPLSLATDCKAFAEVSLPHGARISEMRALVFDSSIEEDITVALLHHAITDVSYILADVQSSDAATSYRTFSTPVNWTVDAANKVYYVQISWDDPADGSIGFNAVRFTYTVTQPLP